MLAWRLDLSLLDIWRINITAENILPFVCFHMYAVKEKKAKRLQVPLFWENRKFYQGLGKRAMQRLNATIGMDNNNDNDNNKNSITNTFNKMANNGDPFHSYFEYSYNSDETNNNKVLRDGVHGGVHGGDDPHLYVGDPALMDKHAENVPEGSDHHQDVDHESS